MARFYPCVSALAIATSYLRPDVAAAAPRDATAPASLTSPTRSANEAPAQVGEQTTAPVGEPAADTNGDIVVTGIRASLDSARAIKRNSAGIVDAIVAEDIGKLPDTNIAQAAQRIPGVQLLRNEQQGAAIAIRGLKQNKIVLNGREAYGSSAYTGEYNGRSFDLQDVPAEVLSGIEISKTSQANQIEGGLGGYVNIRTRRPLDFPGFKGSISVRGTYHDLDGGFDGRLRGQVSALLSDRVSTGLGEIGLLVNVFHGESVFGSLEDEVQRTEAVANYAGSGRTVTRPIGIFTGNGHNGSRKQDTIVAAFDWKMDNGLKLYADLFRTNYIQRGQFQTARLYVGAPSPDYTLYDGTDSLRTGRFLNNSLTDTSVVQDELRRTLIYAGGLDWSNGGPFKAKLDISRNQTSVVNTLYEWGIGVAVPRLDLAINRGRPSTATIAGVDLSNPSVYTPAYLLSINVNGKQTDTAVALDASYRVGGLLSSIDAGARYSDYTRHSFGFVAFYGIASGPATLADVPGGLLDYIDQRQSRDIGRYYSFATRAVRDQAALRSLFGLPARESYTPDNDQLNNEKTYAGYVTANYDLAALGLPLTGTLGVRVIQTDSFGASFGLDAGGSFVRQVSDTSRLDALPSMTAKLDLADGIIARGAYSRTLGPVNFAFLSAATTIFNPVQFDAQRGNPGLKPYTSDNFDLSLEYYFGGSGLLYGGLFKKNVDGFIQTVAVREPINGQLYNISTFASAGTSRIKGAEFGGQAFATFLPAPFDGFGVQANYTYVDSSAPSAIAGQSVPLEGLSRNSYNIIGIYEKGPVGIRVAYNYRDTFVVATSSSGAQGVPIFSAPLGTLDVSASYNLSDRLTIVIDAVNVTGASSEAYYGTPQNQRNYQPLNSQYSIQLRYAF